MPKTRCGFDDIPGGAPGRVSLVQFGPTLFVKIGLDQTYDPATASMPPSLPDQDLHALVDTGAAESCIDSQLAVQLNLPIVDRRMVSGVHGPGAVNMHLAQIHVPTLGFTVYGAFAGVHLRAGGQPHFALIGRTFLQDFTMIYEGRTGTVTLERP